jgi:hypothetical protein
MYKVAKSVATILAMAIAISCAAAPKAPATSAAPGWVVDPRASYPEATYLSAVGYSGSRADAETKAMSSLISVFGQSVKSSSTAVQHYSQAVKDGSIKVDKDFSVEDTVNASFEYKLILGAEIKEAWYDGKSTYYALAAMDKAKSSLAYNRLIAKNEETIKELTSIPESDINSLDAFRRYSLAADVADVNGQFVNILSVLSPGAAANVDAKTGDKLRAEQMKIAQNLAFSVSVAGDRDDRIKTAISSIFAKSGFKMGDAGSARYAAVAKLELSEVVLKGNDNKFARYVVDVQIQDSKTGAVLVPFSDNGRSGQATLAEAENRALRSAESAIKDKLGQAFADYLASYTAK